MIARYNAEDDVFVNSLLTGVVFQGAKESDVKHDPDAIDYLHEHGNKWIEFTPVCIVPGSYVQFDG
jgi:hypothetical protein